MLHRVRPAQTEPATKSAKVEVMLYVEPDKFTAAQKRAAALATAEVADGMTAFYLNCRPVG